MTWLFIKMRMLNHRKQYFTQFLRPLDGVQDGERDPRVEETRLTRDLYTLSSAAVILIFLMPWLGAATASQTQGRFCPSSGLLAASLVYPHYPGPHSTIDCNLATNQTKLYSHTRTTLFGAIRPFIGLLAASFLYYPWSPHHNLRILLWLTMPPTYPTTLVGARNALNQNRQWPDHRQQMRDVMNINYGLG